MKDAPETEAKALRRARREGIRWIMSTRTIAITGAALWLLAPVNAAAQGWPGSAAPPQPQYYVELPSQAPGQATQASAAQSSAKSSGTQAKEVDLASLEPASARLWVIAPSPDGPW